MYVVCRCFLNHAVQCLGHLKYKIQTINICYDIWFWSLLKWMNNEIRKIVWTLARAPRKHKAKKIKDVFNTLF